MSNMMDWKAAAKRTIRQKEFLIAVSDSNFEDMNRLINEGVDINYQDESGYTALFVAIENAHSKVIQFLIDKGVDLNIENNNRETPLNVASRANRLDIVEMLNLAKRCNLQGQTSNVVGVSQNEIEIAETTIQKNKNDEWNNNPVHGNIYQLKVLMLFLYRGVSCKYSFRLGTEMKEARKFDDLVFEYTQGNKKVYRLLQVKHKLDESKKITVDKLFSETHGDYSLLKYFHSYQACKNEPFFKSGVIKDVIICTNIDFDFPNLKGANIEVSAVKENDDILDMKSKDKLPMRYKFTKSLVPKLKVRLQNTKFGPGCNISDDEINDFLQHLVFAVNQPNEEELGNIVKNEISKEFDFITTENTYNKFFIQMLDWMKGKTRTAFWSHKDGKDLFEEIRKGIVVWYNVQDPVKSFTGRRKQLNDIHQLFQTQQQTMICVSGLGGVGKSELVKKYVAEYSQSYDNKIVWINAESYQKLVDSFHKLACDKLGIKSTNADGKEKDISIVVAETYQCFSDKNSLFVFDNSEMYKSQSKSDAGIDKFLPCLPSSCKKPYIIITSRNQKWPKNVFVQVLKGFTDDEAELFIIESLGLNLEEEKKYVTQLGEKLQLLPLALQQAVAYINTENDKLINFGSSFQIVDYLKRLSEKNQEILNFEFSSDCDSLYTQTVFTTWDVTLDALKKEKNGDDALDVLNTLAYLLPDNISSDILFVFVKNKDELASAIALLKQYSLITVEYKVINLHRLVQQVTRIKLEKNNLEEGILDVLLKKIENATVNFKTVDHFLSIWTHSKKYIELVKRYYCVSKSIMETLTSCARSDEVHHMGNELMQLLEQLPSDNTDTQYSLIETETCIAHALLYEGKYEMALKKFEDLLIKSRRSETHHNKTLEIEYSIAITLQKLGKYSEALQLFQQILKVRRVLLGENHDMSLSVKNEIATTLLDMGKSKEAKPILQQIYNAKKAVYGENSECVLTIRCNLATILLKEGKPAEALKMFQDIYNVMKTFLPESDMKVIVTKCNIAQAYKQQKKHDLSFKAYEEVYKSNSPILGENHPQMLRTQMHMSRNLHKMGKNDQALKILRDLLVKQRNVLGLLHPDLMRTQYGIADILLQQGKRSEALQHFQELLRYEIQVLGNDHPYTMRVREHISSILIDQSQFDKALEYDLETFDIYKTKFGMTDPMTLNCRRNIGMLYRHKKEYDKALSILTEVQKDQEVVLGKKDVMYGLVSNDIRETLYLKSRVPSSNVQQTPKDPLTAVQSGNLGLLKDLMKDGVDINTKDKSGMTLLHYAVHGDQLKIVKFLLDNGSDITRVGDKGNTALHIAASKNYIDVANVLLHNVVNDQLREFVDAKTTKSGATALHVASMNGFYEMTRLILSRGATYDVKNKEGKRPIDLAKNQVISGLLKKIEEYFEHTSAGKETHKNLSYCPIDEYFAYTNARNHQGHDILQIAIINNYEIIASHLTLTKLSRFRQVGCKPTFNTNCDELLTLAKTILREFDDDSDCTLKESLKYLRKFVNLFRSLNKRIFDPNFLATEEILKLLECHPNAKSFLDLAKQAVSIYIKLLTSSVYSVKLLESARRQDWKLVEKCIYEYAYFDLADEGGWTPLLLAVNAGNGIIAKKLLQLGAQVNCSTSTGRNTPLHIAASKGYLEIVQSLLDHDQTSDFINAKTEAKGSTALHVAAQAGHLNIVLELLKYHAIYNLKNKDGKSAMDLTTNQRLKNFFKLIEDLFDDAKTGRDEIIRKLKSLQPEEFLSAVLCYNENKHSVIDVAAMNEHEHLSDNMTHMMAELLLGKK